MRADDVRLSVIVPFAPHETEGDALLEQLRGLPADCEIVVVRAGEPMLSTQAKRGRRDPGLREITSPAGRARQMNRGAHAARGHWLWFVHADSRLDARTLPALDAFIAREEDALAYFDLRYANDGPALTRLNALGANLRARWLGLPFGDQGLVLPAAWFARLGGYDEHVEHGEDHRLVWHARHAGLPLRRLGAPLTSSARKYAEHGWWRTTAKHVHLTVRQAWPEWRTARRRPASVTNIGKPEATAER